MLLRWRTGRIACAAEDGGIKPPLHKKEPG
jgi:hypothetical protein